MAGTDFNDIYVNLSGYGANGFLDTNGAMECDYFQGSGSENNALNFEQFRTYLKYRLTENESGKHRIFYIRGEYTGDVDLGSGDANTGVFDIRYDSWDTSIKPMGCTGGFVDGYTVEFRSWDGNPYKLDLSLTTSATTITTIGSYLPSMYLFSTYDIKLYVSGMQVQARSITYNGGGSTSLIGAIVCYNDAPQRSGGISCGVVDDEKYNNKIELQNCTFITNGGGAMSGVVVKPSGSDTGTVNNLAFSIARYTDVLVSNCIFYSDDADGVFVIQDKYPDGNGDFTTQVKYMYIILNSIFLNIVEMYRVRDIYYRQYGDSFDVSTQKYFQDLRYNVMSGDSTKYFNNDSTAIAGTWGKRNLINNASIGMQYSFLPPALSWDLSTLIDDDFNYLQNGWEDITVHGTRNGTTYSNSIYTTNEYTYGVRDGVGALYFQEMLSPVLSASSNIFDAGDTVTFSITDIDYNTTYEPSLYQWYAYNADTPFESGATSDTASLTVDDVGVVPISLTVHSHNNWYTVEGFTTVRATVDQLSMILTLQTLNGSDVNMSTFTVGSIVKIRLSITPNENVRRVGITFNGDLGNTNTPNNNGVWYLDTSYNDIANKTILCKVELVDGTFMYISKTISITDVSYKPYYVDLSKEYEDKNPFKLKYVLYDNFEDGSINNRFATDFRSNYIVKYMYNERVASYNTGSQEVTITRGIKSGDVNVYWSFVRDTVASTPSMILYIDNIEYRAEWDYVSQCINIISNNSKRKISYSGSFALDLTCPNALHTLYCKFVIVGSSFSFMYSTDNGNNYIEYPMNNNFSFTSMFVNGDCDSHSGYGYIQIEANSVSNDWGGNLIKGSEEYPFTYPEMVERIIPDGLGEFADIYRCRNWREVNSDLVCDIDQQYHIDVWNALRYGPWMLRFRKANAIFSGVTLSNGIIYNIAEQRQQNLFVTTIYNMFITWNGTSKVTLYKYRNRYTGNDNRVDLIGSTIKSEAGFVTGG